MIIISNTLDFFNRNWVKAGSNVLFRHYYPNYKKVSSVFVKVLETDLGKFYFSPGLKEYPDLFEQVLDYNVTDIRKSDVVLDIGANIGAFTVFVAPRVKHVIAVEPLFFDELQANVKLNNLKNVTCINAGLGINSGVERTVKFAEKEGKFKTITFSDILKECPYKPNFLKIDCEGAEWCVSSWQMADNFRAIEGEFHRYNEAGRKQIPMRYVEVFKELGFDCEYSETDRKELMIHARRKY